MRPTGQVAEHSATTATRVCDSGDIEIDDEKLQTLRKIVRAGMTRKMSASQALNVSVAQPQHPRFPSLAAPPQQNNVLRQHGSLKT